jgi:hypothetical protein
MMNTPKNALTLVNDVLTRCGQKAVTTIALPNTPVKQTVSFLNQIYEDIRLSITLPTVKEQIEIPYAVGVNSIDLNAYDTAPSLIALQTVWAKSSTASNWTSLRYEPQRQQWLDSETADTPSQFHLTRDAMMLYPTPTQAGAVRLMVEPAMTRLEASTDVPVLPNGAEYLLVLGTMAHLQQFLGELQGSLLSFRLYEEGMLRLKKTYQPLFSALRLKGPNTGYQGI